jgi:hypothetical protein
VYGYHHSRMYAVDADSAHTLRHVKTLFAQAIGAPYVSADTRLLCCPPLC